MMHRTWTSHPRRRCRRTRAGGHVALWAALALAAMFTVTTTATAQQTAPAHETNDDAPGADTHAREATGAAGETEEAAQPLATEPRHDALDERERGHAGAAADAAGAAAREVATIDREVPWQPGQVVPPGYTVGGAYRHDRGRRMVIAGGTLLGTGVVLTTLGAAFITRDRSSNALTFDGAVGFSNMISGGALAIAGIGTLTRGLRQQRVARAEALHYGDHPHVARLDRFAPHSVPGEDWDRWRELRRQGTTLTAVGGTATAAGWVVAISAVIAASRDCTMVVAPEQGTVNGGRCGVDGTVAALIGASGALLAAGIPMTIVGAERLREARRLDAGGSVRTLHLSLSPATSAGAWGSQVQVTF